MDLLLSKNSTLRKPSSVSFKFSSQRPTFAMVHEAPTRYYDFVDTPALAKPSPSLIDRQEISPELESKIRYSCSLLVYRIEQGIACPPAYRSRPNITADTATTAQLESKYISPKVGPETAALKSKYDSGVALTQQPSMQTMRLLNSRRDELLQTEDSIPGLEANEKRTTTSYSTTLSGSTVATERLCITPSTQSPMYNERQPGTGMDILGDDKPHIYDTMEFLKNSYKSRTIMDVDDDSSEDMEVFLNPDTAVDSNGVFSPQLLSDNTSPSLGLSREPGLNAQSQLSNPQTKPMHTGERSTTTAFPGTSEHEERDTHHAGVIIDSNGCIHVLTAAEEVHRNITLQQAAMAKMMGGIALPPEPDSGLRSKPNFHAKNTQQPPPLSTACKIKSTWASARGTIPTPGMKRKIQPQDAPRSIRPKDRTGKSVFRKIASFFFADRW